MHPVSAKEAGEVTVSMLFMSEGTMIIAQRGSTLLGAMFSCDVSWLGGETLAQKLLTTAGTVTSEDQRTVAAMLVKWCGP